MPTAHMTAAWQQQVPGAWFNASCAVPALTPYRSLLSREPPGRVNGTVGEDEVGPRAPEAGESLQGGGALVEPAALGSRFEHGVLAYLFVVREGGESESCSVSAELVKG